MILFQTLTILLAIVAAGVAIRVRSHRATVRAIERALYPEIISMRVQAIAMAGEIARRHTSDLPLDSTFFLEWRLSAPLIYPAVGASLGLLHPDAVGRIGLFHAQLAEARARLAEARQAGDGPFSPYRLLSNLCRAYNHVDVWVDAHQARFGAPIFGYPDKRAAAELLELLETTTDEPKARAYEWADSCWPTPEAPIPSEEPSPETRTPGVRVGLSGR